MKYFFLSPNPLSLMVIFQFSFFKWKVLYFLKWREVLWSCFVCSSRCFLISSNLAKIRTLLSLFDQMFHKTIWWHLWSLYVIHSSSGTSAMLSSYKSPMCNTQMKKVPMQGMWLLGSHIPCMDHVIIWLTPPPPPCDQVWSFGILPPPPVLITRYLNSPLTYPLVSPS